MKNDVKAFVQCCHICQIAGKPNEVIPPAPLKTIAIPHEPFSKVVIDCVGPLPKTRKGNQYLLTVMCPTTRFPIAIPLPNISAKKIIESLIKIFTVLGFPKELQCDRGTNFKSDVFQSVLKELNIKQSFSSAYHPQSQGVLERAHQTMKSLLGKYALESAKDWDENLDLLMFVIRSVPNESIGVSPFEMLFGRKARDVLRVVKENLIGEVEVVTPVTVTKKKSTQLVHVNLIKPYHKISPVLVNDSVHPCEYNVLPFGMCNAPATFQRVMNELIRDLEDVYAYLDDLVVATSSWDKHFETLQALFHKLHANNLTINLSKSCFGNAKVDACNTGIGAVLLQSSDEEPSDESPLLPVSYFSRKFSATQQCWSTVEQKLYGVVAALLHFGVYLHGNTPVTVLSDHLPLSFLERAKLHNKKLLRWSFIIQEFNVKVKHIPGAENKVADALSRI
ncbi:uncharacterized protein [Macrobrachium rosenbergii]|uniref:uncharacterized protein n=1 Tax=Macrobrachium rosenbergii TaxID=79674 RepID=UPI0034D67F35